MQSTPTCTRTRASVRAWPALALLALAAPAAWAAGPWHQPVPDASLDHVRGGYSPGDAGATLTFALQQSVLINGVPTASTSLRVLQAGSQLVAESTGSLLVQIGAGNSVVNGMPGFGPAAVVVQNSLDRQSIQTLTTIDVSSTVLRAYRDLNLQATLDAAVKNSLRR